MKRVAISLWLLAAAFFGAGTMAYALAPKRHVCPAGWRQTTNRQGLGFCLIENMQPPPGAHAYCDYFSDGYMGYYWPEPADAGVL